MRRSLLVRALCDCSAVLSRSGNTRRLRRHSFSIFAPSLWTSLARFHRRRTLMMRPELEVRIRASSRGCKNRTTRAHPSSGAAQHPPTPCARQVTFIGCHESFNGAQFEGLWLSNEFMRTQVDTDARICSAVSAVTRPTRPVQNMTKRARRRHHNFALYSTCARVVEF